MYQFQKHGPMAFMYADAAPIVAGFPTYWPRAFLRGRFNSFRAARRFNQLGYGSAHGAIIAESIGDARAFKKSAQARQF
jgi:hypothetical protein